MKKKGSALMITMILLLALMIIGMAISSSVVSTLKYNKRHSEVIDLELAAKSGLNIFKENLLVSINAANEINNLPLSLPKEKSDIEDFEGITIYKEIIKEEKKEKDKLIGYNYTIISTAVDNKNGVKKEQKQVVLVKIDSDSGEIGDVELNPENVLNIKGNIEWKYNPTYDFLKYTSYGGDLSINPHDQYHKDRLDQFLKDNNISESEEMGRVDFNTVDNIQKKMGIEDFDDIPKTKKEFNESEFKEVDLQYFIDNNNKTINENVILRNDLDLKSSPTYISQYNLNLNNATIIIEGDFISNHNLDINLSNNSNLIIKGDLNISQNGVIKINSSSFFDIKGNFIVANGNLTSEIKENSILNVGGSIETKKGTMVLKMESSRLDVGFNIESMGINNDYSIINDYNINSSQIITRNGGILSTSHSLVLKGRKNIILVNGNLCGNEVKITMKESNLISKSLKSTFSTNNLTTTLDLTDSKFLVYDGVKANYLNVTSYNSDLVFLGDTEIVSDSKFCINDSVIIFAGTYTGNYFNIEINNSMVFIMPSSSTDVQGMELIGNLKVNNIRKGTIYILGNLKAHSIEVYGDKDSKATDDIIERAENLLTK